VTLTANTPATTVSSTVAISNSGGGTLAGLAASTSYTAGQPSGWLTVSFAGGLTTAPATLVLQAATASLGPGIYTATVRLTSPDAPVALNLPVTLRIISTLAASTPAVALSGVAEIGSSGPSTVSISNTGGGTVTGAAVSISYGAGASGWLAAQLDRTTVPATLTLSLRPDVSSPRGTYTATVTINAPGVGPLLITVTRRLRFTYDQHIVNPARGRDRWVDMGPGIHGCEGCHGSTWYNYTYITTTFSTRDPTRRYIDNITTDDALRLTRSFLYGYVTTPGTVHSGGTVSGARVDTLRLWILDGARKN
jgi:hypothetical protein